MPRRTSSGAARCGTCSRSDTTDGDGLLPGAQALRLMGAVHRLVLEGRAPELAAFYPSAGGRSPRARGGAFIDLLGRQGDEVAALVWHPVQTNEPGRSAALLGGFLEVARQTGLPLRLLEIGASAGLNLRWDRYFYAAPDGSWGDPQLPGALRSGVLRGRAAAATSSPRSPSAAAATRPARPASREDRLTLLSYVWPDQEQRIPQLRGALEVAPSLPVEIDRAPMRSSGCDDAARAGDRGVATVVFHSIVLPYLGETGSPQLKRTIDDAGARATRGRPVRLAEHGGRRRQADVRLTTWPGGEQRLLARAGYHGPPVNWLG